MYEEQLGNGTLVPFTTLNDTEAMKAGVVPMPHVYLKYPDLMESLKNEQSPLVKIDAQGYGNFSEMDKELFVLNRTSNNFLKLGEVVEYP